jgi:hypothetical protein
MMESDTQKTHIKQSAIGGSERDEMEKWEERDREKNVKKRIKRGVVDHNYLAPNTDYEKA